MLKMLKLFLKTVLGCFYKKPEYKTCWIYLKVLITFKRCHYGDSRNPISK